MPYWMRREPAAPVETAREQTYSSIETCRECGVSDPCGEDCPNYIEPKDHQRSSADTIEVRCYGCGSTWTDAELIEAKKSNPRLVSCCPERKPLDITGWMARAVAAEERLRVLNEPQGARK